MNHNHLLIKNGYLYDGIQKRIYLGEVETLNGKIIYAGPEKQDNKNSIRSSHDQSLMHIDAKGCIVSPGFIDVHCHEDILGGNAYLPTAKAMLKMGVTTCVVGNCGILNQPIKDFKKHLELFGGKVNYAFFTGYNSLREEIGVHRLDSATQKNIRQIGQKIKEDLDIGAIGISFGFEYAPGITTDEVVELCSYIDRNDIILSMHIRGDMEMSTSSVEEVIFISKSTNLPVIVSHIGSMAAYGQMERVFQLLTDARANGVRIFTDCYPYDAFLTEIGSEVFNDAAFDQGKFLYENLTFATGPFLGRKCNQELYKTAKEKYPDALVIGFGMNVDEINYAIRQELTMISSDGFTTGEGGHPRTAGAFPRVLGRYVREDKIMTLEEALRKMTALPAQNLGLRNKGLLKKDMDADIVIFDKDKILDQSTFVNPDLPPKGILAVIIDGNIALIGNRFSEELPEQPPEQGAGKSFGKMLINDIDIKRGEC